jgi:hypothetical protein
MPAPRIVACVLAGMLAVAPVFAQGGYPGAGGANGGTDGGMNGGAPGGGGRRGGRSSGGGGGADAHIVALSRTYDPDDPIALMLAARVDLKLADSQAVALRPIETRLRQDNGPVLATLDSLRPPGDSGAPIDWSRITPAERDSVIRTRKAIAQAIGAIHDNVRRARTEALALFSADQQQRFADLEQKVITAQNSGGSTGTLPDINPGDMQPPINRRGVGGGAPVPSP